MEGGEERAFLCKSYLLTDQVTASHMGSLGLLHLDSYTD